MDDFLIEQIIEDLHLVEKEVKENLRSKPELLGDIATYLIKAGGKRVRPALVLLCYRAAGGRDIKEVVPIAAAIELIHTASLIHDDINDATGTRRGVPTANIKFGTSNALIAGDFLFVKAFRIGGKYDWEIVKIIADACSQLAEGEVQQDLNRYNTDITIEEYLVIIRKKTASLITACARTGAVLSKTSDEKVEALTSFARNIGMSFQITDDILDVRGDASKTGKPTGNDIREGQLTLLTIRALNQAGSKEKKELEAIIKKKVNTDSEIERAISIVMETDAMKIAYQHAQEYADRARKELYKLEETDFRDNLELIIEMVLQRYF